MSTIVPYNDYVGYYYLGYEMIDYDHDASIRGLVVPNGLWATSDDVPKNLLQEKIGLFILTDRVSVIYPFYVRHDEPFDCIACSKERDADLIATDDQGVYTANVIGL